MAFVRTIPPSDAEGRSVRCTRRFTASSASTFNNLDPALRQALTVGRPVADPPA